MRQLLGRDNVALTGSVIGLASVLFGWLTLRPNRLAEGTPLSLWDGLGWGNAAVIVLLWLLCLVLSLSLKGKLKPILLGVTANMVLVVSLLMAGMAATGLLEAEPDSSRVSLGVGIWLTIAAAYIVIYASRQKLKELPLWQHLVSWTGLAILIALIFNGLLDSLSLMQELNGREARFLQELQQHVFLFGISVTIGSLIGIPLGIWANRSRRAERPVFFIANITQTIPSLALFGLIIAPLSALTMALPFLREIGIRGIGTAPALIALVVYSLLPIVRNTFVGLRQVDPAVIDAGAGMGMSRFQVFRRVKLPLAAPLVAEGVRIASVQAVGLTTVAALIGAGGLGFFVFQGLAQAAPDLIILGTLPIIALALIVDAVMRVIVRLVTPKGTGGQ
ncbi:MAG: ABC transporter permease [Dehalococcoidales bacterium]|nr:ABC transporter permease [Dehalococcoidales bacterium]